MQSPIATTTTNTTTTIIRIRLGFSGSETIVVWITASGQKSVVIVINIVVILLLITESQHCTQCKCRRSNAATRATQRKLSVSERPLRQSVHGVGVVNGWKWCTTHCVMAFVNKVDFVLARQTLESVSFAR
jgi:hypothetical protein